MKRGWALPVVVGPAHYFTEDGVSLCGRYVNPRIVETTREPKRCWKCQERLKRPCGKNCFASRLDAMLALALAEIQRRDSTRRPKMERRAYFCRGCRAFHLTAREEWR